MNNLSRNRPVGFVVGAAGFIGSHLVEELLAKRIQVVGFDNFSTGFRDNLTDASKDKNFELISQDITQINNLELPRLDYAVFIITESENPFRFEQTFKSFLSICKPFNPKIILCSSIDLYDSSNKSNSNLSFAENYLAKQALGYKINARVVRLSAVYGPRMHFRGSDPIIRLIKSAVSGKLNQEATPLEFTTRALYIKDAVKLLIKTIMHGSTAQKIYDGAATHPIKVSEIKQVLMDPLWYEEKGFTPTLLPPWPTPNLNKTFRELSFKPNEDIVVALKETLTYFNSHKDKIPVSETKEKSTAAEFMTHNEDIEEEPKEDKPVKNSNQKLYYLPKISFRNIKSKVLVLIGFVIIFFALIFPFLNFGFNVLMAKNHFENSIIRMSEGNFTEAESESKSAVQNIQSLNDSIDKVSFINQIYLFKKPFEIIDSTLKITNKVVEANYHTINGAKSLASGLAIVSGEKEGDSLNFFADAKTELETADSELGEVSASLADSTFFSNLPDYLKTTAKDLEWKSISYKQTIGLGKTLVDLLPGIIAPEGQKNYLVVLQDNRVLRPGGGVLKAYVEVTFDHGRLLKIKADSIENLDRQFGDVISPPIDLKTDLGETNWRLRDGSYDLDFPTSAHNITWFFNKESGDPVSGVIALDLVAASKLLQAVGSKDDPSLKISIGREGNVVASDLLKNLVERVFYLSKQNWVVLAKNSDESINQKNLLVYLADPNALSFLSSNNWAGNVPLQQFEKIGEKDEFLAFSETNMSLGQSSTALKRSVALESRIDKSGIISHKFTIDFTPIEQLTGKYRNRFKVYFPANTKLIISTWGGSIFKDISPFSDYGRIGYSMLLEINPGEQKQLVLEYQDTTPAKFKDKELVYILNVLKQPSQESIPLEFKLTFPPELKIETNLSSGSGEVSIKTDLSEDRSFKVVLKQ